MTSCDSQYTRARIPVSRLQHGGEHNETRLNSELMQSATVMVRSCVAHRPLSDAAPIYIKQTNVTSERSIERKRTGLACWGLYSNMDLKIVESSEISFSTVLRRYSDILRYLVIILSLFQWIPGQHVKRNHDHLLQNCCLSSHLRQTTVWYSLYESCKWGSVTK